MSERLLEAPHEVVPAPHARRALKILHAFNQHRGGGGADNAARSTIALSRALGSEVEVFTRSSEDLPKTLQGRLRAGVSAIYAPDSVRQFSAMLDSFQPDLVHIHEVFPLVSPWILPQCKRRGVPVVMTVVDYRITCPIVTHLRDGRICSSCTGGREYSAFLHNCRGNLAESFTVALYNTLARQLGLFADNVSRFLAPSDFTREWLIANAGLAPERVTTISPIVSIPERAADPAAGTYVAFAGRFAPEKGIATLLEAARISGLPFKLARHEASLIKVDVPANVDVVVTRTHEDLEAFYRGARVVVVPSIWFETFGLVGAEAMAHGIPIVVSRIGALPHLVDDGEQGLHAEPGDANDLAAKVARIWNDPALARTMGQKARAKAIASWSAERHADRLFRVYDELTPA